MEGEEMKNTIEEIKKRRGAITPGPWHIGHVAEAGEYDCTVTSDHQLEIADVYKSQFSDSVFIASAPQDIDTLLGEEERLRGERSQLAYKAALCDQCKGGWPIISNHKCSDAIINFGALGQRIGIIDGLQAEILDLKQRLADRGGK